MFHLIFESIIFFVVYAFMLIIAFFFLVLCGIYAKNLGHRVYWRRHAQHVTGTLLNIVGIDGQRISFYRYTVPSAAVFEAGSILSAASCEDRELGRQTALLVFPDNPQLVCEDNALFDGVFIDGAFHLFALTAVISTSMREGRLTLLTWAMAGAAVAYIGVRFRQGMSSQ